MKYRLRDILHLLDYEDMQIMRVVLLPSIKKSRNNSGNQKMMMLYMNMYILHFKYLYHKKAYVSLDLMLSRTRQICYLRQLLGLHRTTTITLDILNKILSS